MHRTALVRSRGGAPFPKRSLSRIFAAMLRMEPAWRGIEPASRTRAEIVGLIV